MQKVIFLKPIFHEKIWGGNKLKESFNYDIPSNSTGECWAISAHKNGDCEVINGELKGKKLSEVWESNRELFGGYKENKFPLLTKILDASGDLSVQVHPDDEYAFKHEGEMGKTECWYVLDCDEDAEMIFGHNAQSREEFESLVENNEWDKLLRRINVKPGDFFYVPSGTIHALCKGTLILETQQSSDTTYRVYDYNRRDAEGNTRPLHVRQSIDVATIPHTETNPKEIIKNIDGNKITTYVEEKYFTVQKWDITSRFTTSMDQPFVLVSVIDGSGVVNDFEVNKGDHFIITSSNTEIACSGEMKLIISHV